MSNCCSYSTPVQVDADLEFKALMLDTHSDLSLMELLTNKRQELAKPYLRKMSEFPYCVWGDCRIEMKLVHLVPYKTYTLWLICPHCTNLSSKDYY